MFFVNRIANLRIPQKLAAGFATVLLVIACTGWMILNFMSINERSAKQAATLASALTALDLSSVAHIDQAHTARGFVLTNGVQRHANLYGEAVKSFDSQIAVAKEALAGGPLLRAAVADVEAASHEWRRDIGDQMLRLGASPDTRAKAIEIAQSAESSARQARYREALEKARQAIAADSARLTSLVASSRDQLAAAVYGGGALAFVLAGLIWWLLARAIAKPLAATTAAMDRLAGGDTSIELPWAHKGECIGRMSRAVHMFRDAAIEKARLEREAEAARDAAAPERARREAEKAQEARNSAFVIEALGEGLDRLAKGDLAYRVETQFPSAETECLRDNFNRSAATLQNTIATVMDKVRAISSGTQEISGAADDLSKRTEQQAASLEETAAALEEITATVRSTAQNAVTAHDAAEAASRDTVQVVDVVARTTNAMTAIERSSHEIGRIVGVIDEIAFQTNLLALNAGVEAARAGEAGRGFAVVASEVRALSQRSAESAKEIKGLIAASESEVNNGVGLVSQASSALAAIASQVLAINGLVDQIAVGAKEQSTGLAEISTAMNQMDQATQQNAAMVEETTAASHSLAKETDGLASLMGQFKVGSDPAAVVRVPGRPPAARGVPALKTIGRGGAAIQEDWQASRSDR